MKYCCALVLLLFLSLNIFSQYLPSADTLISLTNSTANFSGTNEGNYNEIKVVASWKNGMLDGPYLSYYPSGQIRAKGQYTENRRTGKWKVYAPSGDAYLVLFFNKYGTTSLRRVVSNGQSRVRFGKGIIHYRLPSMYSRNDSINGVVAVKHGLKHGVAEESYDNGNLYSVAGYKEGLFFGLRRIYQPATRPLAEMEYDLSGPCGMWKFYDENGNLESMRDFNDQNEYSSQRLFIGDYDVLWNQRCIIYIDCTFVSSDLLIAEDDSSLFNFSSHLFLNADVNTYTDPLLANEYSPTHDNPDLMPKQLGKSLIYPRGWLVLVDYFYNIQTSLLYHSVISLCPVGMTSDSESIVYGPWLYFPELRDLAQRSRNQKTINQLRMLKTGNFQFVIAAKMASNGFFCDPQYFINGLENYYMIPENEHESWLKSYGVFPPVCR